MITFTQYLLPHGRKTPTTIDRPREIEELAERFIAAGGWFEAEMLNDYETVSLTACFNVRLDDGTRQPADIAVEVCKNGPEVPLAVDRLVSRAAKWIEETKWVSCSTSP